MSAAPNMAGGAAVDPAAPTYAHGPWEIDLALRELRLQGQRLGLGQRAFVILEVLLARAGEAVPRAVLTEAAWPGLHVRENTLEVHVLALRRALGNDRALLRTVRGRGYQLQGEWRARAAASLQAPEAGNLPLAEDALVGRRAALWTVTALLRAHRLVTLTGAAGIGKTRLALEAARQFAATVGLGAFLVDATTVAEPQDLPGALVRALRLAGDGARWRVDELAAALRSRHVLLLLDGCDHLGDAAAVLAQALITRCAGIRILATGRDTLRIDGEQVWRVPHLSMPREGVATLPIRHAAVALFIERMRQAGGNAPAGAEDVGKIGAICRRLDGLPLAIECAASRAADLGLDAVLPGLTARLLSLANGRRTAPPRHRTLRAALVWSADRLTGPERQLLCRLGNLPARFTLDDVLAVAGKDLTEEAVIEGIARLVEQSLLLREDRRGEGCWRLLGTVRAYALEQIAAAGEVASSPRPCRRFQN